MCCISLLSIWVDSQQSAQLAQSVKLRSGVTEVVDSSPSDKHFSSLVCFVQAMQLGLFGAVLGSDAWLQINKTGESVVPTLGKFMLSQ